MVIQIANEFEFQSLELNATLTSFSKTHLHYLFIIIY